LSISHEKRAVPLPHVQFFVRADEGKEIRKLNLRNQPKPESFPIHLPPALEPTNRGVELENFTHVRVRKGGDNYGRKIMEKNGNYYGLRGSCKITRVGSSLLKGGNYCKVKGQERALLL